MTPRVSSVVPIISFGLGTKFMRTQLNFATSPLLEKNKDYIIEEQVKLMLESKSPFVQEVFKIAGAP